MEDEAYADDFGDDDELLGESNTFDIYRLVFVRGSATLSKARPIELFRPTLLCNQNTMKMELHRKQIL